MRRQQLPRFILLPWISTAITTWMMILAAVPVLPIAAATPAPAHFFDKQLVDHLGSSTPEDEELLPKYWSQRYYTSDEHFGGPGSPIFLVLGGEGATEPDRGLFYDFITHVLAKRFNAYVLQPEHRFYGVSQPINLAEWKEEQYRKKRNSSSFAIPDDPRIKLLTSEQALLDAIRLVHHIKKEIGCYDTDVDSYCPVISVGGSYPGFLSAMARLVYPTEIDMAYAASAPMHFYSQTINASAYYQHITAVAEQAHPGCAAAVQSTLLTVQDYFQQFSNDNNEDDDDFSDSVPLVGICDGTLPPYTQQSVATFLNELFMMVGYTFANHNMAYYPPSNNTKLWKSCDIFVRGTTRTTTTATTLENKSKDKKVVMDEDDDITVALEKLKQFLVFSLAGNVNDCVDMRDQLPTGPFASISGGDWSGVGTGPSAESWDFQTCTLLVEAIGYDETASMFPKRDWSLSWLQHHCQQRFGEAVIPRPHELVQKWKWNDLVAAGASRILFTNGLKDGWSVAAVTQNLSDTLLALNFPNGAHHSDLSGHLPSPETDTADILQGQEQIKTILSEWLQQVHDEKQPAALKEQSKKKLASSTTATQLRRGEPISTN